MNREKREMKDRGPNPTSYHLGMPLLISSALLSMMVPASRAIDASILEPIEAARSAKNENLVRPSPRPDGRINTSNMYGGMTGEEEPIDTYFHTYLHSLEGGKHSVLLVGSAWGKSCLHTLGNKDLAAKVDLYAACDLDATHLK